MMSLCSSFLITHYVTLYEVFKCVQIKKKNHEASNVPSTKGLVGVGNTKKGLEKYICSLLLLLLLVIVVVVVVQLLFLLCGQPSSLTTLICSFRLYHFR